VVELHTGFGEGFVMQTWFVPSHTSPEAHCASLVQPAPQRPFGPQTWPVGHGFDALHCGLVVLGRHAPLVHVRPAPHPLVAVQPGTQAPFAHTLPEPHS
jgi:hypothetical protein